jgi:HSP20 family protein
MALIRFSPQHDPINALLNLQSALERGFSNPFGLDLGLSGRGVFPPVNVFSNQDGYIVRVEVPGVTPEHLNIESQGRTLVVSGKREIATSEGGSFHRRERNNDQFSGQFSRSLQLPTDLDLSQADASCKQGILTIKIPKKEEAKPRQISVKAA